jgi:hypothetical protein
VVTHLFQHLPPNERQAVHNKLTNASLFDGSFGQDHEQLQALLLTPVFEHLTPVERMDFHNKLAGISLFAGNRGMDLAEVLARLQTTEFDYMNTHEREETGQKLKDMHFLNTCTEIECDERMAKAVTEEEKAVCQKAKLKFKGTGLSVGEDTNPWLPALKRAFVSMRAEFPAIWRVSTAGDDNWHAVDTDNLPPEPALAVSGWMRTLTVPVVRARMQHYFDSKLEEYPLTVLCTFRDVMNSYDRHKNSKKYRKTSEETVAKFGVRKVGGQEGATHHKMGALTTGILEVVSLSPRSLY